MFAKKDAFAFYAVLIIVCILIGYYAGGDASSAALGGAAGAFASGLLYERYKSQMY